MGVLARLAEIQLRTGIYLINFELKKKEKRSFNNLIVFVFFFKKKKKQKVVFVMLALVNII